MSVLIEKNNGTFADPVNRRLIGGLLLSLLVHAIVLSMQFGIPGLGLPGFELPWKERRANLQPITIQIANMQAAAAPEKPSQPIVAPTLPVPAPIPTIPLLTPPPPIVVTAAIRMVAPVVLNKPAPLPALKKSMTGKRKPIPAPPPTRLARPAVSLPDTPTPLITQDQARDDNFVVAVPDPEVPVRKSNSEKSTKENAKPNAAETLDQTELSEAELAKSVELALAKEVAKENAEKAEEILKQARKLAEQIAEKQIEQKKIEQKKRELDAELAAQAIEKQIAVKKSEEERQKQLLVHQVEEANKQQEIAAALQKKLEAEEQVKRLQKQELTRLEAQRIETQKKLEEQRQDQQRKVQQLAQELEARKRIEAEEKQQMLTQQKQLDEQILKQKSEQFASRLKAEELATRKAAEQKLADQKLADQKLAEQKLAEQKLAEQKLADQKLAEQKLAEQRAVDQRIGEQKAAAQRERALADAAAASKANSAALSANLNSNGSGNGSANAGANAGAGAGSTNFVLPKNSFNSDLANRAREQTRGLDILSGNPPTPRQVGPDLSSRRRSVLGSFDREVPLRMYVESWRQKVERNGNFNYSQSSKDKARGDPVVIVAIRSDGSVEDVTIVRSSGRADLDEAVGRIVRLNAPYSVFPQNIAAKYDVIEIRRVWRFDETLRILEEVR